MILYLGVVVVVVVKGEEKVVVVVVRKEKARIRSSIQSKRLHNKAYHFIRFVYFPLTCTRIDTIQQQITINESNLFLLKDKDSYNSPFDQPASRRPRLGHELSFLYLLSNPYAGIHLFPRR